MRFLCEKARGLRIGWNEVPLGEDQFYSICRRFRVKVVEMPLKTGGFYYRVMGKDYIAIDSRLSGIAKLLVLYHELAHFLFHTPESGATANFHNVGRRTRIEVEADLFALCAAIPKSVLEGRPAEELVANEGFPAEVVEERLEIYRKFGV